MPHAMYIINVLARDSLYVRISFDYKNFFFLKREKSRNDPSFIICSKSTEENRQRF